MFTVSPAGHATTGGQKERILQPRQSEPVSRFLRSLPLTLQPINASVNAKATDGTFYCLLVLVTSDEMGNFSMFTIKVPHSLIMQYGLGLRSRSLKSAECYCHARNSWMRSQEILRVYWNVFLNAKIDNRKYCDVFSR